MSKKREAAATPGGCGRGEELVAYLYGEATKEEAGLFRQHLDACLVCRAELAALGGVREELGVWRADALGSLPSLNIEEALTPEARTFSFTPRRRSARAALREFFSLSPLWLRAGAFAAVLALCALVALTLARVEVRWDADGLAFRAGASEKIVRERVEVPVRSGYTEEQVNALVAQKIAEAKAQANEQRPEQIVNVTERERNAQRPPNPNPAPRKRAARRTAKGEDSLLAEDNLPRLSDLLNGSY